MKIAAFTMAIPIAVLYVIVLGTVVSLGLVFQLIRDLLRHLRTRRTVGCSWCGGTYVQNGSGKLLLFPRLGQRTGSHGICRKCLAKEVQTLNKKPTHL